MKHTIIGLMVLAAIGTAEADSPQQAFVKAWKGQPVVVKTALYSLVYNERGKLGNTKSGKREGVLVVTSSTGAYFQFDGRQARDTVVAKDLQRLMEAVSAEYEADGLDVRPYRRLEPVAIERFEPGHELVVSEVRVESDELRLELAQPGGGRDTMTSLRIKWPMPFAPSFSERTNLEELVRRFIEIKRR
jgi:hypothetical protein